MVSLSLCNLTISRSHKILIHELSHDFAPGLIYALVGKNGSGKTTLLKTLAGLLHYSKNHIFVDGQDMKNLDRKNRANIISLLLQHHADGLYCTAQNRIAQGLMPIYGFDYVADASGQKRIVDIANLLHIGHLLHRMLVHMSGGEQRLTHLAKSVVNPNTRILLLDEPCVFLDFSEQNNVGRVLRNYAKEGRLVIFSSHDAAFIHSFADRVITIEDQRASIKDYKSAS